MRTFREVIKEIEYSDDRLNDIGVGWTLCVQEQNRDLVLQRKSFDYFKIQSGAVEMLSSGGGFLQCIGKAYCRADECNARKLYNAFKHEFDQFVIIAEENKFHGR